MSKINKVNILDTNQGLPNVYNELKAAFYIKKERVVSIKQSKRKGVYIVWYKPKE